METTRKIIWGLMAVSFILTALAYLIDRNFAIVALIVAFIGLGLTFFKIVQIMFKVNKTNSKDETQGVDKA